MSDPQCRDPNQGANTPEVPAGYTGQGGARVSSSTASIQPPATTATVDEDESEDESEILEESPCGRWQKRREEVTAFM